MVFRACDKMRIARWFVTGLGVGYLPRAPGTAGSLLGVILFIPIQSIPRPYAFLFLTLLFIVSVYTINLSMPFFVRKDPREIVIDEIWAILLVLFMVPSSLVAYFFGFVLFRFFDIAKPIGVREAEHLPGGLGIMADDIIAALYTLLIIWPIHYLVALA